MWLGGLDRVAGTFTFERTTKTKASIFSGLWLIDERNFNSVPDVAEV